MLIDQAGNRKAELARGEHKSIATDRVILVPGPSEEVAIVREVYDLFVRGGLPEREIAAVLNSRGIPTDLGRAWTRGTIHQVLINEKYVGDNVWGRTSFQLKQQHRKNPPELWVRSDGAFEAIVPPEIFCKARAIVEARSQRISDEEMLAKLEGVLRRNGYLSGIIIDEMEDMPSSSSYASRFGSLLRAYALVGFVPDHDYRYLEVNRSLRRLHPQIIDEMMRGIWEVGGDVFQDAETDLLTINEEFTVSVVVGRCFATSSGATRWKIRLDTGLKADVTVAVRMNPDNNSPLDYYLLPQLDMHEAVLRLCEFNGLSLDSYRFDDLGHFYNMASRRRIPEAA